MIRVTPFQLLQWKHAIRLEDMGIKHSRGSVNAHAGRVLGLPKRTKRAVTLEHIEAALDACKAANVPMVSVVEIQVD